MASTMKTVSVAIRPVCASRGVRIHTLLCLCHNLGVGRLNLTRWCETEAVVLLSCYPACARRLCYVAGPPASAVTHGMSMPRCLFCTSSSARAVTLCCHRAAQDEPASAPNCSRERRTFARRLRSWRPQQLLHAYQLGCPAQAFSAQQCQPHRPAKPRRALHSRTARRMAATVLHSSLTV